MLLEEHARDSEPNPTYELSPLESEPFSEPDPEYKLSPLESEPFAEKHFTDIPRSRNVRCQNKTLDTFHMQTNILLVNRQIYSEAISIFNKNEWIRIETDLDELPVDLRQNGYAIICDSFPSLRSVSYPVPYLSLELGSSSTTSTSNNVFIMCRTDLKLLVRALGTIKDLDEMCLDIRLCPTAARNLSSEYEVVLPLFQLRGLGTVIVQGPHLEKEHIADIQAAMVQGWSSIYIIAQTESLCTSGTKAFLASDWEGASNDLEALLTFFCDLQKLVPEYCGDRGTGVMLKLAAAPMAIHLAGARCMLGDFQSAIKYTTYALSLCPLSKENRAMALLCRGQAFARMGESQKSLRDLLDAAETMPENVDTKESLAHLERSLSGDQREAHRAFTAMVISIQREREDEKKAREKRLAELIAERDEA